MLDNFTDNEDLDIRTLLSCDLNKNGQIIHGQEVFYHNLLWLVDNHDQSSLSNEDINYGIFVYVQ